MSDNELDDVVLDLLRKHQCSGERLLQGHLLSNGHLIQRARVRESMNRIDRSNRFLIQEKSFEGPTMCLDQTMSGRYLFICKILHFLSYVLFNLEISNLVPRLLFDFFEVPSFLIFRKSTIMVIIFLQFYEF